MNNFILSINLKKEVDNSELINFLPITFSDPNIKLIIEGDSPLIINSYYENNNFFIFIRASEFVYKNKIIKISNDSKLAKIILDSFIDNKNDFIDFLRGKFFITIYQKSNGKIFSFNDQMGMMPSYYVKEKSKIFFSSSISFILKKRVVNKQPNFKKIIDYLEFNEGVYEDSFYNGIKKITPRVMYCFKGQDLLKTKIYQFNFNKDIGDEYEHFRDLFSHACLKYKSKKLGIFLSGGLDSSSVAAVISKNINNEVDTFSAKYDAMPIDIYKEFDEQVYRNSIYDKYENIISNEVDLTKYSTLSNLQYFLEIYREPFFFPHLNIINKLFDNAKEKNINYILHGMDGDTAISYGYERLLSLLLSMNIYKLYYELKNLSKINNVKFTKLVRILILVPIAKEIKSFALSLFPKKLYLLFYKSNVLKKNFLLEKNPKLNKFKRSLFKDPSKFHNYIFDLSFKYESIEKHNLLAMKKGLISDFPFYDHDLLKYLINLDASYKLNDGFTRYILRESLKDFLPKKIKNRVTKSNLGYVFSYQLTKVDIDLINYNISNPHQDLIKIINLKKIKNEWKKLCLNPYLYKSDLLTGNIFNYVVLNTWFKNEFKY